jgi:hypothetical protein
MNESKTEFHDHIIKTETETALSTAMSIAKIRGENIIALDGKIYDFNEQDDVDEHYYGHYDLYVDGQPDTFFD